MLAPSTALLVQASRRLTRHATCPAYTLVDLFSNYKFDNGLDLGLNVSNLLDEDYTPAQSTTFSYAGPVLRIK